jgi:hypothetical protein
VVHAVTLSDFELSAVVQVVSYNDDEEYYYSGTGYLVDFISGCLVTATHVVVDDGGYYRENNYVVFNPGTEEEKTYWVTPIIAYQDADVAYLCVNDETFLVTFRHYFLFGQDTFDSLQVGDQLTGIGFPSSGGDTITGAFGYVAGFVPFLNDRDLIKMDMDVSAGISGGPVIAENKDVVGMVVLYAEEEGEEISYAVSADLLKNVDKLATDYVIDAVVSAGLFQIPEGCVESTTEGFYTLQDELYYNFDCSQKRDLVKEQLVQSQFEYWCEASPDDEYVLKAVEALNTYGDILSIDNWRTYLDALCGDLPVADPYNFFTPNQDLNARLVKREDMSSVYAVLDDGKRHVFPNTAVFASWYGENFSLVETIAVDELSDYSLGNNVTFHPGTLIKIPSIPRVYLVSDDNELRWIKDEQTAQTLYGSEWNKQIFDVSESLFSNYSLGEDISL